MLSVPPALSTDAAVVWPDDRDPARFFGLAVLPRLARGPDGVERLRLATWQVDGEDRGRLSLEVELGLDAAERAAVRAALEAQAGRPVTLTPPPVEDVAVAVELPELAGVVGASRVSLLGPTRAAVDLALRGAQVRVVEAFLAEGLAAGLVVCWDVTVQARAPGTRVEVHVQTDQLQAQLQATLSVEGALTAGQIEQAMRTGRTTGSVRVEVEGGAGLDPDALDQLTEQALLQAMDRLAEVLLTPLDDGVGVRLRLGRFSLQAGGSRRKTRFSTTVEAQAVLPWRLRPQALLTLSPAWSPETHVVAVDPARPGARLDVPAHVVADFDGAAPQVEVAWQHPPETGPTLTHVFTSREPHTFSALAEPGTPWRARWRVVQPAAPGPWSDWFSGDGALSLIVPSPEAPEVRVVASGLDLERDVWRAEARLSGDEGDVVVGLDAATPEATVARPSGAVRWRRRVVFRDGRVHEDDAPRPLDGALAVVSDPATGASLRGVLLPSGDGWDRLDVVIVEVEPLDAAGPARAFELRTPDAALPFSVPVDPAGPPAEQIAVRTRTTNCFLDGGLERSAWVEQVGGGIVPVPVWRAPTWTVEVVAALLDFAETPAVELVLTAGDQRRALRLDDAAPRTVAFDGAEPQPVTVEVAWILPTGARIEAAPQVADGGVVVVPAWRAPEPVAVVVRADLVDFAATPHVAVSLEAAGDSVGESALLVFAAPGQSTWSVVPGPSGLRYRVQVLRGPAADGVEPDHPPVEGSRAHIVLLRQGGAAPW